MSTTHTLPTLPELQAVGIFRLVMQTLAEATGETDKAQVGVGRRSNIAYETRALGRVVGSITRRS